VIVLNVIIFMFNSLDVHAWQMRRRSRRASVVDLLRFDILKVGTHVDMYSRYDQMQRPLHGVSIL